MSIGFLIAVAVLHCLAGIDLLLKENYTMAMVMAGFTIADSALAWASR